ncbi:P-loop NTPase, partial [Immundisolibacter sp.]|uniref:nucleotide-binding protein n=1 Tax=Immundisolibacter sp. TaxID=1934948 RepID=UPI0035617221
MLEASFDQAQGLRGLRDASPVRVIAITGGKGGVGKTNVAVNLGVALAQRGQRTMLLDADLGLANVDVLLGLQPRRT